MTGQNLLARDDTFFGVCQGIGEDLGFSPNWLRLAFGVSLLWNPPVVIGTYVALGMVVLAARLIAPNPKAAKNPVIAEAAPAEAVRIEAPAANEQQPVPLAA
jgi:phage shock protein PspC (stress-responsive transcriptional regulator)